MTVCQYFLQGRCRFGQNCRFEHSYNNDDRNNRNFMSSQQLSSLAKKVAEIVILAEEGGQWPLSCFSPFKDGANIPGWEDYSPEEIRWKMYEARSNGTLNQVTHEVNQLYRNAEKMRMILKEPTMERINIIGNLIKCINETPSTSSPFTSLNLSSNIFGGSAQSSSSKNIFGGASGSGSQGSIFGGTGNTTGSQGSIFGGSSPPKENIFGNAVSFPNNNIFGNPVTPSVFSPGSFQPSIGSSPFSQNATGSESIFGGSPISSQNIFSNANQGNSQNVFLPQNSSGVFSNSGSMFDSKKNENENQNKSFGFQSAQSDNIFKSPDSFNNSSVFSSQSQSTKSVFGGVTPQASVEIDLTVYSKVEDLNEEEVKSFTSLTFAFGKIPLKPPPQMYCK